MPAILDDPACPTIYRRSGPAPFPDPNLPSLPEDMVPRQVTLRDRQTTATIVPFASRDQLPASLLVYLRDQLNKEIEGGDTYPMMDLFTDQGFAQYWFQNFGAVMLLGDIDGPEGVVEGKDWSKECLGSFYIKPNYPGRSSHVCNAGFLVTDASRGRGVGRLMGEAYIDWAPRLGYTYSVFNLVYDTNVASCRIWDALGFKRIGRVKGCGNLKSYPDRLIDAIIYGRDLAPGESDDLVSEERFDKIKYYLKYGKYPNGADRAEKSRLRSAATHYKLLGDDKLMLKDKEVIADPAKQYDIARAVHVQLHGGINKTTATIAEKYHWSRIKETVSDVIRNCTECKDLGKTPNPGGVRRAASSSNAAASASAITTSTTANSSSSNTAAAGSTGVSSSLDGPGASSMLGESIKQDDRIVDGQTRVLGLQDHAYTIMPTLSQPSSTSSPGYADPNEISSITPSQTLQTPGVDSPHSHHRHHHHHSHHDAHDSHQHPFQPHHDHSHHTMLHDQPHHAHTHHDQYQPIDPQIINQPSFDHYHTQDFQALLNATEDDDDGGMGHHQDQDSDLVDRDLEMLIDHQDDDMSDGMHDHNGEGLVGSAASKPGDEDSTMMNTSTVTTIKGEIDSKERDRTV